MEDRGLMNKFQQEWSILHKDIEKYERLSLKIKLFTVLICVLCVAYSINVIFSIILIAILWLQEGIWKTFQKRMELRIVFIEQQLNKETDENDSAFQFYSQWDENRAGVVGLVKEYIKNSLKPTVAYPYVFLGFLMIIFYG